MRSIAPFRRSVVPDSLRLSAILALRVAILASCAVAAAVGPDPVLAFDAPAFDLIGPKVDVHVQRNGITLPIAEVPNLLPGDRLWIHPDLPESQSAHFMLVVAFLRGATNPPPPEWFKRVDTSNREVREEGVFVVVPAEAQQALVFLAPETIGDFATLRKAVHDRPGAFVRAAQDLQQASWDRLRLDEYLAKVKENSLTNAQNPSQNPRLLKDQTELAARSLGIRVDQQCFDKPTEQQAPCLVQHTDGLVLDDSNAQSFISQMANGSGGDMMNQLGYSQFAGGGSFSPYIGAIVDLAKILSSIHTAKYQYIPALALPRREQKDTLNLRLNVPPSFRDPKSVIVVALPPIGPSSLPQLTRSEPFQAGNPPPAPGVLGPPNSSLSNPAAGPLAQTAYCATKPKLTLFAEGAPLVFATAMAYDLTLHIDTKAKIPAAQPAPSHPDSPHAELLPPEGAKPVSPAAVAGSGMDVPVTPDPSQGGFILDAPIPLLPESEATAQLRGKWGFDSFEGPKFRLTSPHEGGWAIAASDQNALITGREDMLHIQGQSTLCVESVEAELPDPGKHESAANSENPVNQANSVNPIRLAWRSPKPEQLEVAVPLRDAAPGTVTIAIHQYGLPKPDELPLRAYAEAASLDHLTLSTGDNAAVLKGRRLDEVETADLAGITFAPAALNRVQDFDQLELHSTGSTATLEPGKYSAKVTLRDGRQLHVAATVERARPQVELISKGIQHDEAAGDSAGQMGSQPSNQSSAQAGGVLTGSGNAAQGSGQIAQAAQPPVRLGSPNDLPLQRRIVIFLRSRVPAAFPRSEKIEIAATDADETPAFQTTLSFADGSLVLEDAHTAVAVIDPLVRFGPSAFGPIQFRAVAADGVAGDWVPLGTLVRLPGFSAANALRCPHNPAKPCQLTGSNLFLVTAVSANADMANQVEVPAEFAGASLTIPNMARAGGNMATLYLRLRDDPDTIQALTLPVTAPLPPGADATAASSATTPSLAQPAAHTGPQPQ